MIAIPPELVIEGVARAFGEFIARADVAERIITRIAELQGELMTTAEAAEMLRVSPKTLRANHVEWGITKSVALGPDEPRFYRAQILERMREREIQGRGADAAKVTEFPTKPRSAAQASRAG